MDNEIAIGFVKRLKQFLTDPKAALDEIEAEKKSVMVKRSITSTQFTGRVSYEDFRSLAEVSEDPSSSSPDHLQSIHLRGDTSAPIPVYSQSVHWRPSWMQEAKARSCSNCGFFISASTGNICNASRTTTENTLEVSDCPDWSERRSNDTSDLLSED